MIYPRFYIKIWNKKGREIVNTYSIHKGRILYRLNRHFQRGFKCYIKVVYKPGYQNEGNYTTKKDALHAYRAFTEKSLIKEFV